MQYVDIASTINRLLNTAGMAWDWEITRSEVHPTGETDRNGKPQYLGVVEGYLTVTESERFPTRRGGVGCGVNGDPDTALKTADAEALKKAGHKFGIGLELWDEEVRTQNEVVRRAVGSDNVDYLKRGVFELALIGGAEPNAESVAAYFGISTKDLQDAETLKLILKGATIAA